MCPTPKDETNRVSGRPWRTEGAVPGQQAPFNGVAGPPPSNPVCGENPGATARVHFGKQEAPVRLNPAGKVGHNPGRSTRTVPKKKEPKWEVRVHKIQKKTNPRNSGQS